MPGEKNITLDLLFGEIFHGPLLSTLYFYHGVIRPAYTQLLSKIWLRWLLFFPPLSLSRHSSLQTTPRQSPFYCVFPLVSSPVNTKNRIWLTRRDYKFSPDSRWRVNLIYFPRKNVYAIPVPWFRQHLFICKLCSEENQLPILIISSNSLPSHFDRSLPFSGKLLSKFAPVRISKKERVAKWNIHPRYTRRAKRSGRFIWKKRKRKRKKARRGSGAGDGERGRRK